MKIDYSKDFERSLKKLSGNMLYRIGRLEAAVENLHIIQSRNIRAFRAIRVRKEKRLVVRITLPDLRKLKIMGIIY